MMLYTWKKPLLFLELEHSSRCLESSSTWSRHCVFYQRPPLSFKMHRELVIALFMPSPLLVDFFFRVHLFLEFLHSLLWSYSFRCQSLVGIGWSLAYNYNPDIFTLHEETKHSTTNTLPPPRNTLLSTQDKQTCELSVRGGRGIKFDHLAGVETENESKGDEKERGRKENAEARE